MLDLPATTSLPSESFGTVESDMIDGQRERRATSSKLITQRSGEATMEGQFVMTRGSAPRVAPALTVPRRQLVSQERRGNVITEARCDSDVRRSDSLDRTQKVSLAEADGEVNHRRVCIGTVPVNDTRLAVHDVARFDPPWSAALIADPTATLEDVQNLTAGVTMPVSVRAGCEVDRRDEGGRAHRVVDASSLDADVAWSDQPAHQSGRYIPVNVSEWDTAPTSCAARVQTIELILIDEPRAASALEGRHRIRSARVAAADAALPSTEHSAPNAHDCRRDAEVDSDPTQPHCQRS